MPLVVSGAQLKFRRDASGKLVDGQLNGVLRDRDLKAVLIPALARVLSQKVEKMIGMASTNMQILNLFDNGGTADPSCPAVGGKSPCKSSDGTCAAAKDGKIDECEVSTSVIQYVLVPDVQMFDGERFAPDATNARPDSLSLGLSLTGLPAKF